MHTAEVNREPDGWQRLEHWMLRSTLDHPEPRLFHFTPAIESGTGRRFRRGDRPDPTAGTIGDQITDPWRVLYRGRVMAAGGGAE